MVDANRMTLTERLKYLRLIRPRYPRAPGGTAALGWPKPGRIPIITAGPSSPVFTATWPARPAGSCMASDSCFYRRVIPFTAAEDGIYRLKLTPQTWGISAIRVTLHARVE